MKTEIAKSIALLTAEYELPPFSDDRILLWMNALSNFPKGSVEKSVSNYIRTNKFKPQLSDIVQGCTAQVPNAWISADEAWALMPKSENESCMMTNETAEAMAAASPLLDVGDKVAARMAFRGAYERLVERAKLEGRKPVFFPSFGDDKDLRASMLGKAVKAGQYSLDAALQIAPDRAHEIIQIAGVHNHPMLEAPSKEGRAKIDALLIGLKGNL